MPVEIRELIIRAYIEPSDQENKERVDESGLSADEITPHPEIIDEILELIKNKNER